MHWEPELSSNWNSREHVSWSATIFATRAPILFLSRTNLHIIAEGLCSSMRKPSGKDQIAPHLPCRMCAVKLKRIFERYLFLQKLDRARARSGLSRQG